jgi:tetratricopeptide (TPR) repeat protein
MNCRYYGLILCLSFLTVSFHTDTAVAKPKLLYGQPQKPAEQAVPVDTGTQTVPVQSVAEPITEPVQIPVTEPVPEVAVPVAEPVAEPVQEPIQEPQRPVKPALTELTEDRNDTVPPAPPLKPKEQPVVASTTQIDADALAKLLSQMVYLYNDLKTRYSVLNEQYERLINAIATKQTQQPQQQPVPTAAVVPPTPAQVQPAETTVVPPTVNPEQQMQKFDVDEHELPPMISLTPVPQFVKMKYKGKNREIEFYLDPYYADMNFDIAADSSVAVDTGHADNNNRIEKEIEKTVGRIEQEQKRLAEKQKLFDQARSEQEKLDQSKQDQLKQDQLKQDQWKQDQLKKEKANIPEPVLSDRIDKDAVDGIYKAQKLFYAKKYNSALTEVNKSLKKQETALGFAIRGSIYFTLDEKDMAVESWRKALDMDPAMDDVREALKRYER